MKIKISIFIIVTSIICVFYSNTNVYAETINNIMAYKNVAFVSYRLTTNIWTGGIQYKAGYYNYYVCSDYNTPITFNGTTVSNYYIEYWLRPPRENNYPAADSVLFESSDFTSAYNVNLTTNTTDRICICIKGNVSSTSDNFYPTYEDYEESLNPKVYWYDEMWNWLEEDLKKPLGFIWFKNLIDSVFGDDSEGTISNNVTLGNPTLAPTPTPIPYTTVVIPKTDMITGDTCYETNYYYVNPSGTPIVTGSPPTNSSPNNVGGNGNQTYNPIDGKPYSIPRLDWMTSVDIDGNGYDGIDSIADGMSSIDDIGSEYTDGLSAVQDASGTLPTSWLLLIGIVAAIPLLAGIVSRFLGG